MPNNNLMDTFVSGIGILALLYFLLCGLLYLFYGKTLVFRIWQRMGPGVLVFSFLGVLAGKLGSMGYSSLITKVVIPLGGLSIMTANMIVVAKGLAQPIQRAVAAISGGADEVTGSSEQIASASNDLARGATNQAASIEETSSSLEEMSAMTRQNADNAGQANTLMQATNRAVEEAHGAMNALNTSMEQISAASEQTSRIIKTIDEIAFQTNLLALNAAVEAARAGEAGAGFAVVADEVRNLAMRAAEAAKSTAGLIEETVRKVNDGARTVTQTSEVFARVAANSGKAGTLVEEIASASSDQAQGIVQLNSAVTEMDRVVQQNAATAEEAAAATESIFDQANRMREMVAELAVMVFDQRRKGPTKSGPSPGDRPTMANRTPRVRPDRLIPMNDSPFNDF
ncbi:MAG: hypothetical protein JEZ11_22470 [Desulfobacterales bacterium]|nr:hypothetical protein [Desulfobacterales bacterium]